MLNLPNDVLFIIFCYCDRVTLSVLCQVCRRFRDVASSDCLWSAESRQCLVTNQISYGIKLRSCSILPGKEKCRIALSWKNGKCKRVQLVKHRTNYMPWLQMSSDNVWISQGDRILGYRHLRSGYISQRPQYILKGQAGDVCRFVATADKIISGGSDGSIVGWDASNGRLVFDLPDSHADDINGIDAYASIIISGSRDKAIKIWTLNDKPTERLKLTFRDRIWSVALSPHGDSFICGTGGCYDHPLKLHDVNTGKLLCTLGNGYSYGAGVLHILYETPQCAVTCGYDTYIRQWDLRCKQCVAQWENPHDLTVYCLSSDQNLTLFSGSSMHGLVWLWDKRATEPIQKYYVGSSNSPVYSITFDPCHLYVSLDRSLHLLNFT